MVVCDKVKNSISEARLVKFPYTPEFCTWLEIPNYQSALFKVLKGIILQLYICYMGSPITNSKYI